MKIQKKMHEMKYHFSPFKLTNDQITNLITILNLMFIQADEIDGKFMCKPFLFVVFVLFFIRFN